MCDRPSCSYFPIHPSVLLEAREAFIKQFSSLEAPIGGLLKQLHGIEWTMNCSLNATETKQGGDSRRMACRVLARAAAMVEGSHRQLRQATLDLDSMVGKNSNSCST